MYIRQIFKSSSSMALGGLSLRMFVNSLVILPLTLADDLILIINSDKINVQEFYVVFLRELRSITPTNPFVGIL